MTGHVLHRSLTSKIPLAVRGEGATLFMADGQEVLDGSGGAAVACIGHGNRRVAGAIADQAAASAYVHSAFFTTGASEALADHILRDQPGGLTRALFVSSGSEAMEASLKLARQFFIEIGQPARTHFIARRQSYHGATFATLAIGGHRARRAAYESLLPEHFSHVSPCFAYHDQMPGEANAAYVVRLASELDAEFQRVGPDEVIAFCAETIVGATTGCVEPVPGYLEAVRAVCDRYGALLILDEVMCGMGRSGTAHAWEAEGVTPDIQAIGKGLGGGYQPIGAVLASARVVEALERGSGGFAHGQTYQAHPVACAGSLEVQRIIKEEQLIENCSKLGTLLSRRLNERLGQHAHVGDIRGRGLFQAVEFVRDREQRLPFDRERAVTEQVTAFALNLGLAVYPGVGTVDGERGDHVLLAPPFNSTSSVIESIVERLGDAIDRTFANPL